MAIQRGNVSSRVEYYVFRKFSVRDILKAVRERKKEMRIIIAGDGKVGLALTRLLSQEGHDLVTIDSNRAVLERDMQQFDVMTVVGNCATMATLNEAKVQQAEVLIAATSADEINLLCCLTARKMNPTLHTIARVRSPEYREQLYMMRGEFGLSLIINPEREAAKEIFRLLQLPGFLKRETFAKGRVEIGRAARFGAQPARKRHFKSPAACAGLQGARLRRHP